MMRILDLILSLLFLIILSPMFLIIYFAGIIDTGSPIFRQERVGRNQKTFIIYKFRSMKLNTKMQPSHLVDSHAITTFGHFLRQSKIDELPQLWNVMKGEMSIVGPRPCLPTQTDVINERQLLNVFKSTPGITGLAQLNHIDMSNPKLLAQTDAKMLSELNTRTYLTFLILTILGNGAGDKVQKEINKQND